ncbi:MAG: alpha/beta hydrolase [Thermotogae bacterium]|jgi:alpha-beta hydrolase superfamily lysophospholipase|nr:alpha/beta hydrolase [Thermotogota bacterium]MCL5032556.1 alpha/beta hydrolase [Thermotogota bacterium]
MEKITFLSYDGLKIEAEIFGKSDHAVILAHGKIFDMQSWEAFAKFLEDQGFSAIPFNFRGYGNSQSKDFKYEFDVVGAIDYALKDHKRVSVIGASMGGAATLRALEMGKPIDGLVLLSPAGLPNNFSDLGGKAKKALVVFSKGDFVFDTATEISKSLPFETETLIFNGNLHAQNLFRDSEIATELKSKISTFLRSVEGI